MRIICVGEAMVELATQIAGNTAQIGFAGDTLNTAIYLKRGLSNAATVSYATVLGEDQFSTDMIAFMAAEGLDTARVARHPTRMPGLYAISNDEKGERTFTYWRDNSAARTLFSGADGAANFDQLENADLIYLSAITLAILPENIVASLFGWLEDFRLRGGKVVFDSNYRPRLWKNEELARSTIEQAWRNTDIGLPSIDDEMDLFGDASAQAATVRLAQYNMPLTIVKRGAAGPLTMVDGEVVSSSGDFEAVQSVVDSTAAGDSFNAGFLASYLSGETVEQAAHEGHALASKVIAHRGAIIPK